MKEILKGHIIHAPALGELNIMENGYIHAAGTHEELLATSPIYQEVYYSQQKGGDE